MAEAAFYDIHCHALTLSHPSFLAFVETVRSRRMETLYAQARSPGFLAGSLFLKGGERVRNMLSVMENDVGSIFALMEDDLLGLYAKPGDPPPLASEGGLELGGLRFGRVVLAPLLMDFERRGGARTEAYYDRPPEKPMAAQVRDVLAGIRDYRRARPRGLLEIRPFLGIDTSNYTEAALQALLESSFRGYRRGKAASRAAFEAMADIDVDRADDFPMRFAGVKVYPPLGFDPWPDGGPGRDKAGLLYSFCESRDIPLTAHCDDQGFRVIPLDEAWLYTAPSRWRPALEAHPGLRLDLAHFGHQYLRPLGRPQPGEWAEGILGLLGDFARVYTDFSFNGCEPEYYRWLLELLGRQDPGLRSVALDRVMFGSDFPVNLTKVRSYADYCRLFADSPLPEDWKRRFCSDNPERFLTGD
ncbi:MAG TPA: amidohydrolase family protein [Spirochaetia bacterium]|nr:amidohydrolase family protein [Spirochaetales bacterium]HRY71660.1 amidohydrolase family protein [Spirochaetia bacterium]